jgi:hypothetical protein
MIGNTGAHDAAADDHDMGSLREIGHAILVLSVVR